MAVELAETVASPGELFFLTGLGSPVNTSTA